MFINQQTKPYGRSSSNKENLGVVGIVILIYLNLEISWFIYRCRRDVQTKLSETTQSRFCSLLGFFTLFQIFPALSTTKKSFILFKAVFQPHTCCCCDSWKRESKEVEGCELTYCVKGGKKNQNCLWEFLRGLYQALLSTAWQWIADLSDIYS